MCKELDILFHCSQAKKKLIIFEQVEMHFESYGAAVEKANS